MVYVIGSLRQPVVPKVASQLRAAGLEVFDDWYAAGPEADDMWMEYEKERGHDFKTALSGHAARNVFAFDKRHLERARAVVLALPAGKSGHLELGWSLGRGTPGYILLDGEPERFDVMYQFATGVFTSIEELIPVLKGTLSSQSESALTSTGSVPTITQGGNTSPGVFSELICPCRQLHGTGIWPPVSPLSKCQKCGPTSAPVTPSGPTSTRCPAPRGR